ncbi:phospholipase A [Massilia sp. ST3]|uniref:phospholipase A n=1 Tax=Massilia sp. ST3 TaxID=2824903 RepID=UPI001B83C8FF|nr:phospholipase A [Massilia sp. ST3]MBQ5949599.1 phospholipase A [Massilia sp. ST3]
MHVYRPTLSLVSLLFASSALAQGQAGSLPQSMADCTPLLDNAQRLACFDRLAASQVAPAAASASASAQAVAAATPVGAAPTNSAYDAPRTAEVDAAASVDPTVEAANGYTMSGHWELDAKDKRGTFVFRPHNPNYLIATRTYRPNDRPYLPFREAAGIETGLSKGELEFQLGFKMKLVETLFEKPVDVWFGYTQNSFWQAGNHKASSPFRETNYSPELMVVTPLNVGILGTNLRFLNLGFVHQSNGQSSTLSRSWNRFYAQVGLERGPLSVTAKVWKRVNESLEEDNNPEIIDYLGRAELAGSWRLHGGHELTALLRHNFHTHKGSTQLGWAFPVAGPLKGYLHWFSGYGQSMIDYNYFQRSVGAGVVVKY